MRVEGGGGGGAGGRAGVGHDENDALEARVPLRAATTGEVAAAAHTEHT